MTDTPQPGVSPGGGDAWVCNPKGGIDLGFLRGVLFQHITALTEGPNRVRLVPLEGWDEWHDADPVTFPEEEHDA